jgi:hypothetical protein
MTSMLGLRDASLETWSQPKESKALEKIHKDKTSIIGKVRMPKLEAVAFHG